jgi:DNA repair exonuclease SbcCD ATPase subunit
VADYTVAGFKIPESIAHIVEASGEHQDVYSGMLEKDLQNLLKFITAEVQKAIQDTGLLDKFNTFVSTISTSKPPVQLSEILKWVVGHYKKSHKNLMELDKNRMELDEAATSIRQQHAEATAGIRELENNKNKAEADAAALAREIENLNLQAGLSSAEIEKAKAELASRNASAQADIKRIQDELAVERGSRGNLEQKQKELTQERQEAEKKAEEAKFETAGLQSSMVATGDKLRIAEEENARIKEQLKITKSELEAQVKTIQAEHNKKVKILSNKIQLDEQKIADLTTKLSFLHPSSGQKAKNHVAKAFTDLRNKLRETMGPSKPTPSAPTAAVGAVPANPTNNHTEETLKALDFNGLIHETERLIKECEEIIRQKEEELAKLTQSGGATDAPAKEISELKSKLDKLKKSLEALKGAANNRGSTMAEGILQGQIETLTGEKHELEQRVTSLQYDLNQAKNRTDPKIAEKQAAIDAIQKKLDEMTSALGKQQADSQAALTQAEEDSKATIKPLNDEIKALKSVIAANGISMANKQRELLNLKQTAETAQTTHNNLLAQLDPLKKQLASAAKDPSGNLIPSAKYEQLLADIAEAQTELTAATNNIATKTGEINTLKENLKVKGLQLVQATTDNTNKQNQINLLKSTINALNIQLQTLNTTLADINERLKLKDKDLAETHAELKKKFGVEKQRDALKDRHDTLTNECNELKQKKVQIEQQLEATQRDISGHGNELASLSQQVRNTMKAAETQRTGLLTKVTSIAEAIEKANGGQSLATALESVKGFNDDGAFYQLYKRMEEYDNKIKSQLVSTPGDTSAKKVETRDICYLNYFVGFFIKEIFFTPPFLEERKTLYASLDKYVDTFLNSNFGRELHLGDITSECFQLLYAAETYFLSLQRPDGRIATTEDERYHVIEGVESKFLKNFYNYTIETGSTKSLGSRVEVYVQQAFPDYFFNNSLISYMPPFGTEEPFKASPGFTLLTDENHVVDRSAYVRIKQDGSYENVQLADSVVLVPVTQNNFIRYPTLLALYIIFARRYLVSIGDTLKKYHCPLSMIIQNPPAIQDTVEPAQQAQVSSYMKIVAPKTVLQLKDAAASVGTADAAPADADADADAADAADADADAAPADAAPADADADAAPDAAPADAPAQTDTSPPNPSLKNIRNKSARRNPDTIRRTLNGLTEPTWKARHNQSINNHKTRIAKARNEHKRLREKGARGGSKRTRKTTSRKHKNKTRKINSRS